MAIELLKTVSAFRGLSDEEDDAGDVDLEDDDVDKDDDAGDEFGDDEDDEEEEMDGGAGEGQ